MTINLGATQWKYLFGDPTNAQATSFDDSSWTTVGVPYSADQLDTFINTQSGGGDGDLNGPISWYRNHFTLDAQSAGSKVLVEFEGAHTGVQVYINGTLLPGVSAVAADAQATHVVGFVPFIVDLTPYVKFGATNVLAVRAAKNAGFFEPPGFSQAFRFGQSDSGLFRPVDMFITAPVHIPQNVYSNLGTWGTYVATVSASDASALIEVQTNVLNEGTTAQPVTLTTQIVDADGTVVASAQSSQSVAPNTLPGLHPQLFDQQLTVTNPTLWYPNNSVDGKPYMYKVFHIVSIGGTVVDAVQSPLGIRTITWDQNVPYFNGKPQYLWGASGRYDYPGLGTAVPEEQKWRDLELLAEAGGNLWRPGHSTESEEFVNAADAYGIMIVQPSGEGEGAFSAHCGAPPCDIQTLKSELHRDMIIRDRNHPSILAWEANNGAMDTEFAQSLKALSKVWDPINTRAQADRTPNPANGDILGCTLEGCEVLVKQEFPNNPAWGSEYWGTGTARQAWDYELAFAAPFLDNWRQGRAANAFGMAQWYFADSPGENSTYVEGVADTNVRSLGASMVDMNRFPKMLYYIYEAAWTPYSIKPVVHLAHHWNRSGPIQVNAFSNCPAVRLLVNGVAQGSDQVPNPWDSDSRSNLTQTTTMMPFQAHWNVVWTPGTATVECLDAFGNVVASDSKTTAGAEDHIELDVVPELQKPDGTSFTLSANGSDAAFVVAKVVDAQGNVVPTAADNITFAVTGPATYIGGSEQYVTPNQPLSYHAPGDPELQVEGGMTKIALRSQFATGTVTVSATAPGLKSGSASYTIGAIGASGPVAAAPQIIVPPAAIAVTAGQPAQFTVTATGAAPLSFQWQKNGSNITGAITATYQTPATSLSDNGATYSVVVTNGQGNATSTTAALAVVAAAAPAITTQPAAQTAAVGQNVVFSVAATGSPTLTYQWQRNGTAIAGATGPSYTTPVLALGDSGAGFSVLVSNPVGQLTSATAALTVTAATAPGIVTQPQSLSVLLNQPASFSVTANGSQPLTYQWQKNGANIAGATAASFAIAAVQTTDAASYSVVVSNVAGTVTSAAATLSLAPPGVNLALYGKATASSYQDPVGMPASAAFDGNLTTRWGSAIGIDPSWIQIDLGSVQSFDRVILHWENASATQYQILWSNDNSTWNLAYSTSNGVGGVEDFTFPTVQARYVRMNGQKRATQYGYSLYEFQIYNVAQCGGPSERYTVLSPSTVLDNASHLTWQRQQYTLTQAGAQFTQPLAASYCSGIQSRLPTQSEALAISGASAAQCAFPQGWNTWTSTPYPPNSSFAYTVSSSGTSNFAVADNFPGWALCTAGSGLAVTSQPNSQAVALGQPATFSVTASGTDPLTYQWFKNGTAISGATAASYTTPATVSGDNGAQFYAVITDATSLSTTSNTVVLTLSGAAAARPVITTQPTPQTVAVGQAATFTVAATDTAALTYQWFKNNAAITGATTASYTTPVTVAGDTGTVFYVVVTDSSGATATSNTALLTVTATGGGGGSSGPGVDVVAISAGAKAATGNFAADMDFTGGNASGTGTPITTAGIVNAAPQAVYQNERNGVSTYTVPGLTAGTNYTLRLHFAEFYWTKPGQRVFNVAVNGTLVLPNFDVVAAAGGSDIALVKSFTATANAAGQIIVALTTGAADQPKISGIEVVNPNGGPVITTQPANQVATLGQPAIFSVTAGGTAPLTYQWYRNGSAISGATAASYATPATIAADSGATFTVTVSGSGDIITSNIASLQVTDGGTDVLAIASGSTAAIGNFAADADFSAGATTSRPGTPITVAGIVDAAPEAVYQNERAGVFNYTIPHLTAGASYTLRLHFAEFYWTKAGQRVFNVAVNGTPMLSNFDIVATAGGPDIAVIKSVTATANSSGQIIVNLTNGTADQPKISGIEVLTNGTAPVTVPPAITTQPAAQSVAVGQTATFTVVASGTGPLSYQWSKNGTAIAGATGASYTTPATAASDSGALFSVVVTGVGGATATSNTAALTVTGGSSGGGGGTTDLVAIAAGSPAAISGFAADADFNGGGTTQRPGTAISVAGIVNAAPEAVYQNERAGVMTYTIPGLTPGGGYALRLHFAEFYWSAAGQRVFNVAINGTTVLSNFDIVATAGGPDIAVVTPFTATANSNGQIVIAFTNGKADQPKISGIEVVNATGTAPVSVPGIASQPTSQTAIIGRTAQFSVGVSGTGPFTYQWQKNGVAIPSATAATYTTPGTTAPDNNAAFAVVVTNSRGATTSATATLTVNTSPVYTTYPGFIGTDLNNNTNGVWADGQIYVTILGNNPTTGALSWVNFDGTVTAATAADNNAPNHLTAGGQNYPNYAFTLAQSKLLKLPPLSSGRIYISEGAPLYMKILADANGNTGYAGPNPLNQTDPNISTHYDWYEFTYGTGGLFINTTQVDEFGLPLLLDVWGSKETFHMQTGINESIAALDDEFVAETPAAFHLTPPSDLRIFSPGNSSFNLSETNAHYFDGYVSSVWSTYATTPLTVSLFGGSREFSGTTTPTQFVFTEINLNNGAYVGGTYAIAKPSTQDIVFCSNTLATGNTVQLALEAQFCAAFNRHVMQNYASWTEPSSYYLTAPANSYAQFWHDHSVAGLAYGFAYDDVNNQSSSIVSGTPEHMAFGIGW
ncbi:MAG: beta-1,3-glucanase family protein [Aliidongia sp.]